MAMPVGQRDLVISMLLCWGRVWFGIGLGYGWLRVGCGWGCGFFSFASQGGGCNTAWSVFGRVCVFA